MNPGSRLVEADSHPGHHDQPDGAPASRAPSGTTIVIAAMLVVCGGLVGAGAMFLAGRAPSDTSVDAGFARDMQTHHAQAVQMALLVRDRTDDEPLRTIAYDIATSQQQQLGQMYGWLVQWGLPQTASEPPMAWMQRHGHDMGGADRSGNGTATMPGMATDEQLDQLAAADGVAAERLFLTLMIAHHRGGVEMAEVARSNARTDEVRTLATAISEAQEAEIALLRSLLSTRG
ncbi:MAG: DUF305 domain-containing protein [Dermatophilaceae bacterium]